MIAWDLRHYQFPRLQLACQLIFLVAVVGWMCASQSMQAAEPADPDMLQEPAITADDREHWSFQPIVQPALPAVAQSEWAYNAIDCFVLEALEQSRVAPSPEADPVTLLRRLKFDLLGLPPTPRELDDFLRECQHDATTYQRWVERWLASAEFGERQAQPWLDLARFAETDGFEHDKVREGAWRYRDWVIAAFNRDLPYDRFLELQLHGDLSGVAEDHIATMFCLAGADMPDINEQDLRRHDRLNELTSTVGAVLLGLQIHCAQCHDHKYDPISQADFYRLRGVFEAAVPTLQRDQPFNMFDGSDSQLQPRLYYRGELHAGGPSLSAGFPRIAQLPEAPMNCDEQRPRESLVQWLTAEENPLVARVMVNRVWQQHFGKGLFENPNDVGVVAGGPTHPELLDWLAVSLREQDWSLKALHRQIVLSATYRQASRQTPDDDAWAARLASDPRNDLYSRYPRRRLEAEVIRDALISVAGLSNSQAGGPGVMPPLPRELTGTLLKGQWQTNRHEEDHFRRSIYVFARRNLRYPLFDVFDRPDASASCPERNQSTTALQALQMLNSELSMRCATALSQRVDAALVDSPLPREQRWIEQLFRLALARPATGEEVALLQAGIADESSRTAICLALLNCNEFLVVD